MYYRQLILEHEHMNAAETFVINPLDYNPVGLGRPGIDFLMGGDHGKGSFRMFMRFHFSSPRLRKEKGDMSFGCPQLQTAFIDCKKDH
jgi:hypothetical protein